LYNSLAQQTISVEREPKFQTPALPSEIFWIPLQLQPSKIAWAPAPQACNCDIMDSGGGTNFIDGVPTGTVIFILPQIFLTYELKTVHASI